MPILPTLVLSLMPCAPVQAGDQIAATLDRVRTTAREELWRRIPWGLSLSRGLAEARRTGRPLFLFTYDGTLDDGNC